MPPRSDRTHHQARQPPAPQPREATPCTAADLLLKDIESEGATQVTFATSSACTSGLSYPYRYQALELVLRDETRIPLDTELRSACVPTITRFYRDNSPIEPPDRCEFCRGYRESFVGTDIDGNELPHGAGARSGA